VNVHLLEKRLPGNDNDLLYKAAFHSEGKAWAAMLRKLAGNYSRDEGDLRARIRTVANMIDPRPGVIDFPREWTTLPDRYAKLEG
jgi:hypothetical protein